MIFQPYRTTTLVGAECYMSISIVFHIDKMDKRAEQEKTTKAEQERLVSRVLNKINGMQLLKIPH